MLRNAEQFLSEAIQIIRNTSAIYIREGIFYKSVNSKFNGSGFKPFEDYENQLIEVKKTIYPSLSFLNLQQKEFIQQLESEEKVLFYLKIPSWFAINTPFGKHSPDWAVLVKRGIKTWLMVFDLLSGAENDSSRQHCVKKHFDALGIQYCQFRSLEDLHKFINPI